MTDQTNEWEMTREQVQDNACMTYAFIDRATSRDWLKMDAKIKEQAAEIAELKRLLTQTEVELVDAKMELTALKSAMGPVSVTERLPGEGWWLVRLENGDWAQRCMGHCGEWTNTDGGITHWMPLPPAPGAEKEQA